DGGGVGALSELIILEHMMYRLQDEQRLETMHRPCEYFELIGGSGTGGIVALMLGRMRMSVAEATSAYETLSPVSKFQSREKFNPTKFEEALQAIFGMERMKDDTGNFCRTFVCAMNTTNMNAHIPVLFRSYDSPQEPAIDCAIWEAARATSATPQLFKPIEIWNGVRKQRYVDGGIGNNNPTSLV
ncbi:acyl transferase/acyl hydrolase/lysophospholipase, partial [Mycena crocata]